MADKKISNKRSRVNRFRKDAGQKKAMPAGWQAGVLKIFCASAAIMAMSLVFVFGYDLLTQCDYFAVEKVEVSGIERLTRKRVLQAAKIADGVNILSVNLNAARKRLHAMSWVENAEIRREFPDTFIIRIREHSPVAVIEMGGLFLINTSGEIFTETGDDEFEDLPVITGIKYTTWKTESRGGNPVAGSVIKVIELARKEGCVLPFESIKKISVDKDLGLTVTTGEFPAEKIHLGFGGYEDKYRRLSEIFSYLKCRGVSLAFKEIDLRYKDRIVARPAEDKTNLTKLQKEA